MENEITPRQASALFARWWWRERRNDLLKVLFPEGIKPLETEKVVARIREHFPDLSRDEIYRMPPARLAYYLEQVWKNEATVENDPTSRPRVPGKATVGARMIDLVADPKTHTWTVRQFAERLNCSVGAIQKTSAWRELRVARELKKMDREKVNKPPE